MYHQSQSNLATRLATMATITDRKAQALKPDDNAYPHGGITGLSLHPLKTKGHGQWKLRYISPTTGKRRTLGLGSYPEVSITEATRLGTAARELIAIGRDPIDEREIQPAALPTFEQAALRVYEELLPSWKNAKHGQQWINTLSAHIFPALGSASVDQLRPSHFADALRPIWLSTPETASRIKQRCHAVMAWCWAHDFIQANPLDVVTKLLPPQKGIRGHQPAMPWRAIPAFILAQVEGYPTGEATRPLLLFLLLTAARSGEARAATWDEIDFQKKIWVIPGERMKAGIQHRVPLCSQALKILQKQQGLHDDLVFPSPTGKVTSDMILTSFLRRTAALSDVDGKTATAHGFRSSFRDWASENGYRKDLAERALAHSIENKVEAAYHRTDLLEERRDMMQAWADFLLPAA